MDILDIDEILKDDSFCNLTADQKMDDSITSILQQWKQNEAALGTKGGTKLVDTRTFTRPKKRGMDSDHDPPTPGINLQVGGLVTSMRRSLIGETSPPSSFCSSVDSMNEEMLNSLINSGDFNNVSFFMENMDDSANINFNGYKLEDVIRDRQFLDTLTLSEDQTFSKDASIARTDDLGLSNDSSDSNPLINITMKLNPQFEGTFVAGEGKNTTFDVSNEILGAQAIASETFNLMGDTTIENPVNNVTFDCEAQKNGTFVKNNLNDETFIEKKVDQPEKKTTPDSAEWLYQSTPLKNSRSKENHRKINLSPIKCGLNTSKEGNFEKYLQEATNQAFTPDRMLEKAPFEDSPEDEVVELRRLPIPINLLREDERQSLKNFEEYEKTLMQDAGEHEKEFEDVLGRFAALEIRQSNEKMRQSLDSIKKRHSLVNLEKQQEEAAKMDSNKLSESMSKSRRLLRRSRIYDDMNHSPDGERNQESTVAEEVVEKSPVKGNRDRFKTIRIVRPLDQNSPHLPDAGDTTITVDVEPQPPEKQPEFKKPTAPVRNIPKLRFFKSALAKPMSQQKFNSADDLLDANEQPPPRGPQSLKSPMGVKSKSIHNLMSGQRSLAMAGNHSDFKSSADGLNKSQPNSNLSLAPSSKFGKSNQSLGRLSSKQPASDAERYKIDTRTIVRNNQGENTSTAIMRNNPKRLGLVRPSSGYYSYSVRRNDSDTESGRYSPQSLSSSSASSKGSLHVPEAQHSNPDATFDSHQTYNSLQPDKRSASAMSKVPRPSGLRMPSNFRTGGGASALPRPSGIPRR
ncbi:uncharacterized protein LOC132260925 [Phlebotomus argentipes]|uniref:uncharacterized protein LOC132260925 n=1 Tax=Phlebotomus argentipes TaxID=94469 RepID=UPI0028937D60|nr:uncharacterized protein LOC132260925 [Phlebotomus argentipes]